MLRSPCPRHPPRPAPESSQLSLGGRAPSCRRAGCSSALSTLGEPNKELQPMSGAEPRSRLNSGVRRGKVEEVVESWRAAPPRAFPDAAWPVHLRDDRERASWHARGTLRAIPPEEAEPVAWPPLRLPREKFPANELRPRSLRPHSIEPRRLARRQQQVDVHRPLLPRLPTRRLRGGKGPAAG